jgi:hypothetical protein
MAFPQDVAFVWLLNFNLTAYFYLTVPQSLVLKWHILLLAHRASVPILPWQWKNAFLQIPFEMGSPSGLCLVDR